MYATGYYIALHAIITDSLSQKPCMDEAKEDFTVKSDEAKAALHGIITCL